MPIPRRPIGLTRALALLVLAFATVPAVLIVVGLLRLGDLVAGREEG